mmetsp:Transcript_126955/g.219749  ORF Transcript_126955/g.219749 Transcript_126955/m.219749 type:complete len:327 (-) Transcript_126955:272-1252(-)
MGCAASTGGGLFDPASSGAPGHPSPSDITNDELQECFWVAGSVQLGVHGIPRKGPFRPEKVPPQPPVHKILFDQRPIGPVVSEDYKGLSSFPAFSDIYAQAFFPHCLTGYTAGWVKLRLSPRHPHYNCRKQREREKENARLGLPVDLSKQKKYFMYPENVSEIGIFLAVDGKKMETDNAVQNSNWKVDHIPGAFFTFTSDHGSIFGENSMAVPLCPNTEDDLYKDKRWFRLALEFQRLLTKLSAGNHEFKFDLKYRYGNIKFTAWCGEEGETGVYRYSDEYRQDTMISESVAQGSFTMKLTSDDLKKLKKVVAELDVKHKAMASPA